MDTRVPESAMRKEFDYRKSREEYRINIISDNQSIHNHLFYTGQLGDAQGHSPSHRPDTPSGKHRGANLRECDDRGDRARESRA